MDRYENQNNSSSDPASSDPEAKARRILLDEMKKQRRQAFGYDKESLAGLFNSGSRQGLPDMFGVPVAGLAVIGALIALVIYGLSFFARVLPAYLTKLFLIAYLLFIGIWLTYRIVVTNRAIAKLESDARHRSGFSIETAVTYVILLVLIGTVASLF